MNAAEITGRYGARMQAREFRTHDNSKVGQTPPWVSRTVRDGTWGSCSLADTARIVVAVWGRP